MFLELIVFDIICAYLVFELIIIMQGSEDNEFLVYAESG
jgi:hypothetical protein